MEQNQKIKGKVILKTTMVFALIYLIAVLIAGLILNNGNQTIGGIDPELARAMTYDKYREGEEVVDGTNKCVEFSAFFLRDIDGDGNADKIKGTCKEIGKEDTLYLEINVLTEGELKDSIITLEKDNFYFNTAIVKDTHVKNNYINENTSKIELNTITNGSQKLLQGNVRSGDYRYRTNINDAIGDDTNKYSGVSKVKFEGTYVAPDGTESRVTKEIDLTVDWYGETKTSIPVTYANNYDNRKTIFDSMKNLEKLKDLNAYTLNFKVATQETANELLLTKSHIEGTIPTLNGYKPLSVKIGGINVKYTYNEETMKYTAWRDAQIDENGKITSNAYSLVYNNNIYNEYVFWLEYPIEAYATTKDEDVLVVPISAYYEGCNNRNEEFINPYRSNVEEANHTIIISYTTVYDNQFSILMGEYKSKPDPRYIVSKAKPSNIYNKLKEQEEEDYYTEAWKVYLNNTRDIESIILKDTKNLLAGENEEQTTNQFIKSDTGSKEPMGDIVKYVGIYFEDTFFLGDNSVRIYNDETNELIKEFTSSEVSLYSENRPYYYPEGVKHIRAEVANKGTSIRLTINNIKEIDDQKLTTKYTREEFNNLSKIEGKLVVYANYGTEEEKDIRFLETKSHSAIYESLLSITNIECNPKAITTQETSNTIITVQTIKNENENEQGWINGTFLLKFPPEIIDLKVNSINISGSQVNLDGYDVYEQDGNYYIKVYTSNETEAIFNIIIDCELTPDPLITTTNTVIELYATNEQEEVNYYYRIEDKYDVNNNGNTEEFISYRSGDFSLVSPTSLLTSSEASEYDKKGSTAIAPRIAHIDKDQRESKISLKLTNNYGGSVSDVKVLGKVAFEGNTYILNGNDLNSEFTVTMQNTGLEIPEQLKQYAKVYYSTNESPTVAVEDTENGWVTKENVTNWNEIKSYLIILENFDMPEDDTYTISYKINIPEGLNYNDVTYCAHAVEFSLNTEEGKYKSKVESNKLGIMVAKQYDLELTKYQVETEKLVAGATYSVTDLETEESKTAVTGENGKLVITGLYAERKYKIKEIKSPTNYALNTNEITINTSTNVDDNLEARIVSGTTKSINQIKEEGKDWKVTLEVEDEPTVKLEIINKDKATKEPLSGTRFKITGKGKSGSILSTNSEGKATSTGLYLREEYEIEEVKANGYFLLSEPIKLKVTRNGGEYSYTIINGEDEIHNIELTIEDGIPSLKLEIENEPRPTYTLEILKVEADTVESIIGATFKIEGPGLDKAQYYTTNEDGQILIDKLYIGTDAEEAVEYTITETEAPVGYIKIDPITFKVYSKNDKLVYETISGEVKRSDIYEGTVSIIVEDEPVFKLVKKDGDIGTLLPNVKFALYLIDYDTNEETFAKDTKGKVLGELETINGVQYRVLTTNENGQITQDLPDGMYRVVELETLEAYELPEDIDERSYYFALGEGREGKVEFYDNWNKNMQGLSIKQIIQTSDRGYLINGTFSSEIVELENGQTLKNNGNTNTFILKYNENKELLWGDSVGGTGYSNDFNYVVETTDKGYVIAGHGTGGDITLSDGTKLEANTNHNMVVVKYNIDGSIAWSDIIGGDSNSNGYIKAITAINDGGIMIGGYFQGASITSQNTGTEIARNNEYAQNGIIIKYDKNGNVEKQIIVPFYVYGIKMTEDNSYLALGQFGNTITLSNGESITSKGSEDIIIVKYDNNGNIIWYDQIGGNKSERTIDSVRNRIIATKDNGYIVIGSFYSETLTLSNGDKLYSGGNVGQTFIIKYTEDGKIEWSNQISGDSIYSVTETIDGGLSISKYDSNYKDYIITKLDKNGKKEWDKHFKGMNIPAIKEISSDKYILGVYLIDNITLPSGKVLNKEESSTFLLEYDVEVTPEVKNLSDANKVPAATAYKSYWGDMIGGTGDDGLNSISATSDGGYIVGGYFSGSMQLTGEEDKRSSLGGKDGMLIKYNENNEIQLCITLNGTGNNSYYGVKEIEGQGYIALAQFSGTVNLSDTIQLTAVGDSDGLIIKYDYEGNISWYDSIGSSGYDCLNKVSILDDGSIIAVGCYTGSATLSNTTTSISSGGNRDGIILKYNTDGELKWHKEIKGGGYDEVVGVTATTDGGFAVSGTIGTAGYIIKSDEYISLKGGYDVFIAKYDSEGNVKWQDTFGSSANDWGYGIAQTSDGGFVISSRITANAALSNGEIAVHTGTHDTGLLVKYNNDGNIEYFKTASTNSWGYFKEIVGLKDGGFAILHTFYQKAELSTGHTMTGIASYDAALMKFTNDGKLLSLRKVENSSHNNQASSIAELKYGDIVIAGPSCGYEFKLDNEQQMKNHSGNVNDALIIRYNEVEISPEQQGNLELNIFNDKKEYKIQTTVKPVDGVKGGTISGIENLVYETVKYGESNTKPIVMTPNENYELVSIAINGKGIDVGAGLALTGPNGAYTIPASAFTNITEDIKIEAQYALSSNKITIEKVSAENENAKVEGAKLLLERIPTEDDDTEYSVELETNSLGKAITSIPFGTYKITELEAPEGYVINEAIANIEFTEMGVHEFKITDVARPRVVVKHYLNNSEDAEGNRVEIAEEEIYYGDEGEDYTTSPRLDLEGYELLKDEKGEYILPEGVSGKFGAGEKVVEYYYQLKDITLTVHYYKEGTEEAVPLSTGNLAQDFTTKGHKGDNYTTQPVENIDEKYELIEIPGNAEGTYEDEPVVVIYYYRLKTLNITTKVVSHTETDALGQVTNVKGGSISGEGLTPYEEVVYGENSKEDIVMTPDEKYRVKAITVNGTEIEFTENNDGKVTLSKFQDVTEDKAVEVEFEKQSTKVTVHHYISGTENKVPSKDGGVIEDEIKTGKIGAIYATRASENISNAYKYESVQGETSGIYKSENIVVTYYYSLRGAEVITHHYIYDGKAETDEEKYTKIKLVPDEVIEGTVEEEYTATKSINVPANYRCVEEEPEKYTGQFEVDPIEVNYYYELITPTVENTIENTATANKKNEKGEAVLTKEDGEVIYNIKYNPVIKEYQGKAEIEIVDTLPAVIDIDKSKLDGGIYDREANTITWKETVRDIDTFESEKDYTKEIQKQITIVYAGQNPIEDLNSSVTGKVTTYYPDEYIEKMQMDIATLSEENEDGNDDENGDNVENEETPSVIGEFIKAEATAEAIVKQEYTVHFTLEKLWDDNDNLKEKRPNSIIVEIIVMPNDRGITREITAEDGWVYEEAGLPKYSSVTGEKIEYIVTEKETNKGDLEYYEDPVIETLETIQTEEETRHTVSITNKYKLMETDLSTVVTKTTGTEEMTNKEETINYTINLTSEVSDYIGEGKVTIVDTLPYAIDEEKSTLANGVYDEEKRTITWEEVLPHINTEELEEGEDSYKIDITKEIAVVYKDIELAEEKLTNVVNGKVELYETEEKDEGAGSADTAINVKGKVIVKYLEKETEEELAKGYEIVEKIGTDYKTNEKEIEHYILAETTKNEEGKVLESTQEVIYYYESAKTEVVVKYQDEDGNDIEEETIIEGYIGEDYAVEEKEIEDYRLVEVKGEEEGKLTKDKIIIRYVYEKIPKGKVIVKYIDIDTEEEITYKEGEGKEAVEKVYGEEIIAEVGEAYETEEKEIPYYKLVKTTENEEGEITAEDQEVIYYYEKLDFNMSIEKTISNVSLNGEKVKVTDNKLVKIEIPTKEIENTRLVVTYNIKVTNEGEIAGKATILEEIPEGYELVKTGKVLSAEWEENKDGTMQTEVELEPEESKELELILTWINTERNLGSKENIAKIIKTENEANFEDTNKEDDKETATVIVSIKTGIVVSIIIVIMIFGSFGIAGYMIITTLNKMGKGPNIKGIKFLKR